MSRHKCHRTRLNRSLGHRTATLRNLAKALILQTDENGQNLDRIETTAVKAKTLRPFVEKLITLAKKGTVHHRRQAFALLAEKTSVHRLFEELGPRYASRNGGYTRIMHTRRRMGDGAEMAFIELVDRNAPQAVAETEQKAEAAKA